MKKIGKKFIAGLLSVMMVVGVMGCGLQKDKMETPEKVPSLTISNGEITLTQENSIGSWSNRVFGDKWKGYDACGSHPLEWEYDKFGTVLENVSGDFSLQFSYEPKTVEVTYWKAELANSIEPYDSGIKAEVIKGNKGSFSFQIPTDEAYICMIYVKWEEEAYHGDGTFGLFAKENE